jgi:hypothetical protein
MAELLKGKHPKTPEKLIVTKLKEGGRFWHLAGRELPRELPVLADPPPSVVFRRDGVAHVTLTLEVDLTVVDEASDAQSH